ncbi:MAG: hypothetical protein J5661_04425 [Bacteroidaceae bacterium]|nr:hypothetical protein [Bacteroidaceae bacterium]
MSALLTKALNEREEIVDIETVVPGKFCNCICPNCKKPLIAKNRKPLEEAKREHHFAHYKGCLCEASDETVLHQLAKEIIVEEKSLMFPVSEHGDKPSGLVHFVKVEQEKRDEKFGFRPDVEAIMENGERILIEFYVSHEIPPKKRNIIVKNNLKCIEVDLNYVTIGKREIRSFLLDESENRSWIEAAEPLTQGESKENYSLYSRNPWHIKAIEYLKKQFDEGEITIGRNSSIYNLREYGYDICELSKMYRKFRLDLLLYRSKKENKGRISLSVRGRRRNQGHKTPTDLRVIDIIIRNESDYNRLIERDNICCTDDFIMYEGFNFNLKNLTHSNTVSQ